MRIPVAACQSHGAGCVVAAVKIACSTGQQGTGNFQKIPIRGLAVALRSCSNERNVVYWIRHKTLCRLRARNPSAPKFMPNLIPVWTAFWTMDKEQ